MRLMGVIPPKEKRGSVMIDPPYEIERKGFPQLVELLQAAHKKWPTGVFAVWYPIKDRAMCFNNCILIFAINVRAYMSVIFMKV